jgi:hypothetical protein
MAETLGAREGARAVKPLLLSLPPKAMQDAGHNLSRMRVNSHLPRLLKKVHMQGGARRPSTQRSWIQAYWRYAAVSAEAGQRSRWAFFSSLLHRRGDRVARRLPGGRAALERLRVGEALRLILGCLTGSRAFVRSAAVEYYLLSFR